MDVDNDGKEDYVEEKTNNGKQDDHKDKERKDHDAEINKQKVLKVREEKLTRTQE